MRAPSVKSANPSNLPLPDVAQSTIEKIASKADTKQLDYKSMDAEAARNFISTTMPFNEYEDTLLKLAVEKSGHKTVKGFIREAYLARALQIVEGKIIDI